MRKIIITVIATIILIAPLEKAKGQDSFITSANFPTVNIHTGINAKLSFGLWRFEPFVGFGYYFQVFEERMTIEGMGSGWDGTPSLLQTEDYSERFTGFPMLSFGMKFRITDRNRIKIGHMTAPSGGWLFEQTYLGYIHKINLLQRVSLDLSVRYGLYWGALFDGEADWNDSPALGSVGRFPFPFYYQFINFGARLNYEIVRNLKLNVQLGYTRRYNVSESWHMYGHDMLDWRIENTSGERLFTRNLIDFSVGIHLHLGRQRQQPQQIAQRQPRQRVAPSRRPTHRVAPSTFNHPTLPPRGR